MKKVNWKILILTVIICLVPIISGIILYESLPNQMPIHFNINNKPDNYASKDFALFLIPVIMAFLQTFCCLISDINQNVKSVKPKFISIIKWLIPILTVLIYTIMLIVSLGNTVNVGRIICLFLGIMFLILGNYMPKMTYENSKNMIHPKPKNEKAFRKMIKINGYGFITVGIILIIISFFIK